MLVTWSGHASNASFAAPTNQEAPESKQAAECCSPGCSTARLWIIIRPLHEAFTLEIHANGLVALLCCCAPLLGRRTTEHEGSST
jgi:hypothetical protein